MTNTITSLFRKARPQLLVVEDSADQWCIIRQMLRLQFPEVDPVWVTNAEAAMARLKAATSANKPLPKLILSDLYLPRRVDGLTLVSTLKTDPCYRHIPVTILSYSNNLEDIRATYVAQSDSYVVKPTTIEGWLACFVELRRFWWQATEQPLFVC